MMNATDGQFLTLYTPKDESRPAINVGDTPHIDHYQEFYLKITDDYGDGTKSYERVLFQDDRLPQRTLEGQLLPLDLYGREAYLKKIKIPGHFWFITYADMVETIVKYYNAKRGYANR